MTDLGQISNAWLERCWRIQIARNMGSAESFIDEEWILPQECLYSPEDIDHVNILGHHMSFAAFVTLLRDVGDVDFDVEFDRVYFTYNHADRVYFHDQITFENAVNLVRIDALQGHGDDFVEMFIELPGRVEHDLQDESTPHALNLFAASPHSKRSSVLTSGKYKITNNESFASRERRTTTINHDKDSDDEPLIRKSQRKDIFLSNKTSAPTKANASESGSACVLSNKSAALFVQHKPKALSLPEQYSDHTRFDGESDAQYQLRMHGLDADLRHWMDNCSQLELECLDCTGISYDHWMATCSILRHDPKQQNAHQAVVQLPGLTRKLYPCQANTVVITLLQHHSPIKHTFQGHDPGFGKTTIIWAVNHLQHLFNLIWYDINAQPYNHFNSSNTDVVATSSLAARRGSDQCQGYNNIFKRYGLPCPCNPQSPSTSIKQNCGIHVILSTVNIKGSSTAEFKQCYTEGNNPFNMGLVMAHSLVSSEIKWAAITAKAIKDMTAEIVPPCLNAPPGTHPTFRPTINNSRWTVITTAGSFLKQFLNKFHQSYTHKGKTFVIYPVRVASLWIDECHKGYLHTSTTGQALRHPFWQAQIAQGMSLNGLSGTLLHVGPRSMLNYVSVMTCDSWKNDPVLKHWAKKHWDTDNSIYINTRLEELVKQYDRAIKKRDTFEEMMKGFFESLCPLLQKLVLRVTASDLWLDRQTCIKAPSVNKTYVSISHPGHWNRLQEEYYSREDVEWMKENRKRKAISLGNWATIGVNELLQHPQTKPEYIAGRCISSAPALVNLQEAGMRLTFAEWNNKPEWRTFQSEYPLRSRIEEVSTSSGKLAWINTNIVKTWKNVLDPTGVPTRSVILTKEQTVANMTFLWMRYVLKILEDDIVFLHNALPESARIEGRRLFNGELRRPGINPPRYLIGTTVVAGEGLSFDQAKNLVLMEPLHLGGAEVQASWRAARMNNPNRETNLYILIAGSNEERIKARNEMRDMINEVYTMQRKATVGHQGRKAVTEKERIAARNDVISMAQCQAIIIDSD